MLSVTNGSDESIRALDVIMKEETDEGFKVRGDAGIEAEVELSDKSIILPEDDDTLIEKAKEVLGDLGYFAQEM